MMMEEGQLQVGGGGVGKQWGVSGELCLCFEFRVTWTYLVVLEEHSLEHPLPRRTLKAMYFLQKSSCNLLAPFSPFSMSDIIRATLD